MTHMFEVLTTQGDSNVQRYLATVRAIEGRGIAGCYRDGLCLIPDADAISQALPAHWRTAWSRSPRTFWYMSGQEERNAYRAVYGSKGKRLFTIYVNFISTAVDIK